MLKVMIVDDNKMFRQAFKMMVDWTTIDYCIAAEAINGKHAIELLEEEFVDIIITDMSMPEMNGLDLIKYLIKNKPEIKIIVISNYDDFNFVKDALKLGATDYLLKHEMTAANIVEVLNQCKKQIEKQGSENFEVMKKLQQKYLEIDHFTGQLIHGQLSLDQIQVGLMQITRKDEFGNMLFIMIQVDDAEQHNQTYREWLINQKLNQHVLLIAMIDRNKQLLLMNDSHVKSEQQTRKKMVEFVNKLRNISLQSGYKINVMVSGICRDVSSIPCLYKQCSIASDWIIYEKNRNVIYYDSSLEPLNEMMNPSILIGNTIYQDGFMKEKENVILEIKHIFLNIKKNHINLVSVNRVLEELTFFVLSIARTLEVNILDIIGTDINLYQLIQNIFYIDDKENKILEVLEDIYKKTEKYAVVENKEIRSMMKYIENNYQQNLTLASVASLYNYSPNYLSTLFKNETGKNMIEYIKYVRIRHAKELIIKRKYKTYEIAEITGFKNTSYFCTVFKEMTGVSPKEYKAEH